MNSSLGEGTSSAPKDSVIKEMGTSKKTRGGVCVYKVFTIVLSVVVAIETLVLICFVVMFSLNNIKIVSTAGGKHIAEIYSVCDKKMIDNWNKIYDFSNKGDNANPVPKVKQIANDAKKLKNYDKDPTCQYFIFQDAVYDNDTDSMQKSLDAIEKAAANGVYVNDHILYRQSIDNMKDVLKQFKHKR